MSNKKNLYVPLAFVGLFFFSIGFALGINSFLMPVLKGAMDMSAGASSLLLAATFVPFLLLEFLLPSVLRPLATNALWLSRLVYSR